MAGGRPKKYAKEEKMQEKIDEYFSVCDQKEDPPTVCGLALALDMTRETLLQYEKQGEFSDAIKRAKMKIAANYERMMITGKGSAVGLIFNMKNNFGWRDQQEVKHSGSVDIAQTLKAAQERAKA